jgi:hypothetical protein
MQKKEHEITGAPKTICKPSAKTQTPLRRVYGLAGWHGVDVTALTGFLLTFTGWRVSVP